MSSQEDDVTLGQENGSYKKRRGPACDKCRSKKVRCDGRPGERCTNCIAGKYECTYVTNAKKRYPDLARIEELETQLANMKKLLNKLHPGVDFTPALNGYVDSNSLWMVDPSDSKIPTSAPDKSPPLPLPRPSLVKPEAKSEDLDPSDDDDDNLPSTLERSFKALALHAGPPRFLGKSSRFNFYKKAYSFKYENVGLEAPGTDLRARMRDRSCNELWQNQPWVIPILQSREVPRYTFPEPELIASLVDLYYDSTNRYLPLLHRPTFEQHIKDGLHFTDEGFGSILLLVCAIGSRFSDDPRVLQDNTTSRFSAGWKWFLQVQASRKLINVRPPRLEDLQLCCLAGLYLHSSVVGASSWAVIGHGVRIAQEMGAHRRKRYSSKPTLEGELMKRAFWVIMIMDVSVCGAFGRTCVLQEEDYDTSLPLEVDDEYWLDAEGKPVFQQPPDKVSKVTFFNCFLGLKKIHAFSLRTVYAINQSKVALGRAGPQWEQDIVSEIDSALNAWVDSVPEHLRWDPHREDMVWFNQSAFLWAAFYNLQINIHRAFIPASGKASPMSFASLAICTNAARSCIHIMETQHNRSESYWLSAPNQNPLFTSAVVLLLNMWGSKRFTVPHKDMEEVHKAIKMLRSMEQRWYAATKYSKILLELAYVGDLPIPQTPTNPTNKRPRSPFPDQSTKAPSNTAERSSGESRHIAGSKRLHAYSQAHSPDTSSSSQSESSHTPVSSNVATFEVAVLDSFPPLADASGLWPSASTISTMPSDTSSPLTVFPPISHPSEFEFKRAPVQPVPPPFPPLDQNPPYSHETANYQINPSLSDFATSSSGFAASAPGPHDFHTTAAQSNGILDNDTLAMWSFAPPGFEWDEWGTYANNMSELAGSAIYPTNL